MRLDNRERRQERPRRKKRKQKQQFLPILVAVVLIIIVALVGFGNGLFEDTGGFGGFGESKKKADLNDYYDVHTEGSLLIILNHERSEERGLMKNGAPYIPLSLANSFEEIFYYDQNENRMLATTADRVDTAEETCYFVGNGQVYVLVDWVKQYVNLSCTYFSDPDRIILDTKWESENRADVEKNTYLRTEADNKATVIEELPRESTVTILSADEKYSYVLTENGNLGYVDNKKLGDIYTETPSPAAGVSLPAYTGNTRPYNIVLGWHNVASEDGNDTFQDAVSKTKGMNVISPTWFCVANEDGTIMSIASRSYVEKAHQMGLEVWGMVDNFTETIDSKVLLSHTSSRQNLAAQLITAAKENGLDGLNIDFEQLPQESGEDFAQFLREISILTRREGLVLSVDNYVPRSYNDYYRRDIQGRVCDYVIIMGYDEHTNASGEAGSVASIDFVTDGIENTLIDVPAQKVINAVPFYTRRWVTEGGTVDSVAVGMAEAQTFLKDHGQTAVWDDVTCQNMAQFEQNGALYSIWLEDSQSISAKLSVMQSHGLAGVACWRLMLETSDIWDVISAYYPVP